MLSQQQEILIAGLDETDYGRAFFASIREDLELIEDKYDTSAKICDDPLIEDFRVQLGMKIALKMVLEKPKEMRKTINQRS